MIKEALLKTAEELIAKLNDSTRSVIDQTPSGKYMLMEVLTELLAKEEIVRPTVHVATVYDLMDDINIHLGVFTSEQLADEAIEHYKKYAIAARGACEDSIEDEYIFDTSATDVSSSLEMTKETYKIMPEESEE